MVDGTLKAAFRVLLWFSKKGLDFEISHLKEDKVHSGNRDVNPGAWSNIWKEISKKMDLDSDLLIVRASRNMENLNVKLQ